MPQNSDRVVEQVIAEALRRELEKVSPPPAEQMWQGINARLSQPTGVPFRQKVTPFFWKRAATVAAAMLVLVAGVAGLYRLFPVSEDWNTADSAMVEETGDFLTVPGRKTGGDNLEMAGVGRADECRASCQELPADPDKNCLQKTEYALPEDVGAGMRAARYTGPGVELIYIKIEPAAGNLRQLLAEVEGALHISYSVLVESEKSSTIEDSAGNLGLVAGDGTCHRLLLVKEGRFTENELWEIFDGLEEP